MTKDIGINALGYQNMFKDILGYCKHKENTPWRRNLVVMTVRQGSIPNIVSETELKIKKCSEWSLRTKVFQLSFCCGELDTIWISMHHQRDSQDRRVQPSYVWSSEEVVLYVSIIGLGYFVL